MAAADIPRVEASIVLAKPELQRVLENLRAAQFTVVGPRVREGAIVLDELESVEQLPLGWSDRQRPASYRLERNGNGSYFDFNLGPQSWKQFLYPPRTRLLAAVKNNGRWEFQSVVEPAPRYAFVGVRACELQAIRIQDRVFAEGEFRDPAYTARRENAFLLAVNCTRAASTCFCTSMKTGPAVAGGHDLALTETQENFVVEVGSEAGAEMLRGTGWKPASSFELGRAAQVIQRTERQIQKQFRTDDLPRLLYDNLEHPRWDHVAARCLSCANCTLVCPTCFCSTVEDSSDLVCQQAERVRVWDSCFVQDFSHVHGGNIRPTIRSRYRQWLTHKLASWIDQFGSSGCVGCGRCITWCPVGIDLTEEVNAIRGKAAQ